MKISVKVKFKNAKNEVVCTGKDEYVVYVKSAPIGGKANEEVIKKLTKYFRAKNAKIIAGKSFFKKTILITN